MTLYRCRRVVSRVPPLTNYNLFPRRMLKEKVCKLQLHTDLSLLTGELRIGEGERGDNGERALLSSPSAGISKTGDFVEGL